ncbi:FeoB-associated Cys-rich membrane protein [Anaerobium acetethylicum]|uniref:Virus attachment protein p12 family protein n=1 Tax=Anaerobium acetethylicum TaxID=1619234 RepID=A0A1D3TXK5_9FIRM|nr:FeoB-associated Cys-rich membrane protein [Anaerobium acetethylicum]SCP99086.1 Virus attachment protein p12 family protein [Anaerobium acetethylicum]
MMPTIIVGVLFFAAIGFGAYKSIKSMRNNSCPGCSGGCSAQQRKSCGGRQ